MKRADVVPNKLKQELKKRTKKKVARQRRNSHQPFSNSALKDINEVRKNSIKIDDMLETLKKQLNSEKKKVPLISKKS